mgnify:CR=1 FL=1
MRKTMKLDELTKSNIWTISESDLYKMLLEGKKKEGFADKESRYMNIIHSVFDLKYFDREDEKTKNELEEQQYELFYAPSEGDTNAVAIRKRRVTKITDLTLENVAHLLPDDILTLIENNMGTGWQGLPLAIQDIIESAFFVDVSLMPEYAMHRKGGIIDRHKDDDYDVLEIPRGNWIEGIFIKPKPKMEKMKFSFNGNTYKEDDRDDDDEEIDEENDELLEDNKDDMVPDEDRDEENDEVTDDEPSIEDIDVIDETDETDDEEE